MNTTVARKRTGVFILECGGRTFRADPFSVDYWITETDSAGTILQNGFVGNVDKPEEAREMVKEEVTRNIRAERLVR